MKKDFKFYVNTPLAKGLKEILKELESRLSLKKTLNVYLAGGMAIHLYTSDRYTMDIDAEFGGRVFIPGDLTVDISLDNGEKGSLYFDTNYNSTFALMHEDYIEDSIFIDLGLEHIRLHVLSPLDLAVSKISRFAENDREDICQLVRLGLTTSTEIEERATSAMAGYVGGEAMLKLNLRDALLMARKIEAKNKSTSKFK